jgi:hypothetical protein
MAINDDIETPGFYWIDNKLKSYHINHPRPSKKKVIECCNFLDVLVPILLLSTKLVRWPMSGIRKYWK